MTNTHLAVIFLIALFSLAGCSSEAPKQKSSLVDGGVISPQGQRIQRQNRDAMLSFLTKNFPQRHIDDALVVQILDALHRMKTNAQDGRLDAIVQLELGISSEAFIELIKADSKGVDRKNESTK